MPEPAIRVEDLGKAYRRAATLRESFAARWAARGGEQGAGGELRWALRGVGFDVMPGEGVGVLGHNGAGKSTLLKILARVTRPTTGRFQTRGRIAAILELHAGLDPEWTGRQNVFAKAATVGAHRSAIRSRFDEIVAFAELEDAIALPVKRYSTGMRTRLAVATVLHLDSDVLILDEALAGADHHFQQKCRRRLMEIRGAGTALLLVSHNAGTLAASCPRGITLENGMVVVDGSMEEAMNALHLRRPDPPTPVEGAVDPYSLRAPRPTLAGAADQGSGALVIRGIRVCAPDGRTVAAVAESSTVGVEVTYDVREPGIGVVAALIFRSAAGSGAFTVVDADLASQGVPRPAGRYRSVAWLPPGLLAPGRLMVGASLRGSQPGAEPSGCVVDPADGARLEVLEELAPAAAAGAQPEPFPAIVRLSVPWTTAFEPFEPGIAGDVLSLEATRAAAAGPPGAP